MSASPGSAPAARISIPAAVEHVLGRLWGASFAAYVVGGAVRDSLLGRAVTDWDIATSALPEQVAALFPDGRYENRFGTVTVPSDGLEVQVTTFRRDHQYADHRRPDSVTFTDSIAEDLARRDFTINAIAWGRGAAADGHGGEPGTHWVDPTNGMADIAAGILRAVGEPAARFDEDGLRLLRAARFSAQLGFAIEPGTLEAMMQTAATVRWLSNERVGGEIRRMVATNPPSVGFSVLAATGVLAHSLPELGAERGVPQDKIEGHDLLDHSLTALDAAAELDPGNERLRLAALLHDVGKPGTYADGHFVGHDVEGAMIAEALLTRLAFPRREVEPIADLIRNHMFNYEPRWSAAAVRRFIRRVGRDLIGDLLLLRAADNIGSGLAPNAGRLDELRERIDAELSSNPPLTLSDLAVRGDDLTQSLGIRPGPVVGRLLERLLSLVIADPAHNRRDVLLARANDWLARESESAQPEEQAN